MKHFFCLFLALLCANAAIAQNSNSVSKTPDARLSQVYDADYLQRLQTLQPDFLQRLNYYLDNSYSIVAQPEGKSVEHFVTIEMPANRADFNIFKMEREQKVQRLKSSPVYFRIANSTDILCLLSEDEFVKKFNTATGRVYAPRK
jgi:hypothetical protein